MKRVSLQGGSVHPPLRWWLCAALGSALLFGCGDDDAGGLDAGRDSGSGDGAVRIDAPIVPDASSVDASPMDAEADAGQPCPAACDPTGSAREGCVAGVCVLQDDAPFCAPMPGRGMEGASCESTEQCGAGLACFLKRTGGVCGRICCRAAPACGEEERCGGPGQLVDRTEVAYGECLPIRACDVLDPEGCELGEACYITSSMGDTGCREAGDAGVGEMCTEPQDCARGLTCSGFFEMTCARICSLERDECPADEGRCVRYAQSPPGTGLCTVDTAAR